MILDLSGVLSEQHTPVDETVPCTMEKFMVDGTAYQILSKSDARVMVEHVGEERLKVAGTCRLVIEIPCGRCLKPVPVEFGLEFEREVGSQVSETVSDKADELDENNYIDGYHLDVDRLLYNDGICNVCGQNLNEGACSCEDTRLDPRMSVIRDVFKNFKEV